MSLDQPIPSAEPRATLGQTAGTGGAASAAAAVTADAAREARRMRRLTALEAVRDALVESTLGLNNGMAGRLMPVKQEPFNRVKDPFLAMSRLSREVRCIVALEERVDEDAETRAVRRAAEVAERQQAALSARMWRDDDAAVERIAAKKKLVRHAMRDIHRDAYGDIPHPERECELDDLITDYEDYDDYSGSPAEIVARICDHADIVLTPDDSEPDPDPDRQRAQAVAVADGFLRAIDPGYAARHGAPKRGPPDG